MAKYDEKPVVGVSYTHARSMYFENPYGETPSLLVREVSVIETATSTTEEFKGEIRESFSDMGKTFHLRDMRTGLPSSAVLTYQELWDILTSLAWALAEARDEVR